MNGALRKHMESLSRASLSEMLRHVSLMLTQFEGSPHLSRDQEFFLMAAAQSLDAAVELWTDAVARHEDAHGGATLPALQPLPEMSALAEDCILKVLEIYNVLKESNLTRPQVQRLTIAAYNLLVVGSTVTSDAARGVRHIGCHDARRSRASRRCNVSVE